MSSPPPGDSDQRSPGATGGSATAAAGGSSGDASAPAVSATDADTWIAQAGAADPAADAAYFDAESAASGSSAPKRAAPLVHEAAHVRERLLGAEREAARGFAQS